MDRRERFFWALGILLIAFSAFGLLSLLSYSPADVTDYRAGTESPANFGGWFGARLSFHLLGLYGVAAIPLLALCGLLGAALAATRGMEGLWGRCAGGLVLVCVCCAWAGTLSLDTGIRWLNLLAVGPGGILGTMVLSPLLTEYFGRAGRHLALFLAAMAGGLLLAQNLTEAFLGVLGRGVLWGLERMGRVGKYAAAAIWSAVGGGEARPLVSGTFRRVAVAGGAVRGGEAVSSAGAEARAGERGGGSDPASVRSRIEVSGAGAEADGDAPADGDSGSAGRAGKSRRTSVKEAGGGDGAEGGRDREDDELKKLEEEAIRQARRAEEERLRRERALALERAREARRIEEQRRREERERAAAQAAHAQGRQVEGEGAKAPADYSGYRLPPMDLLEPVDILGEVTSEALIERGKIILMTLRDFKVEAKLANITHSPSVTTFELELAPGVHVNRVVSLADNLQKDLKALSIRIIAPIPGKSTVGVEVPNPEKSIVRLRPLFESNEYKGTRRTLPLCLGRDTNGNGIILDLAAMPHLLIGGTTGSGKSVCINDIIISLLMQFKPNDIKLILVDPKMTELSSYKGIPHLLTPVVTDYRKAAAALEWAAQKMDERYERLTKVGCRSLATYNAMSAAERLKRIPPDEDPDAYRDPMPYIVIIVDEFADLMACAGKDVERAVGRLTAKARAAGIHVIMATQRPSVDVVTGTLKTNLPCRIAFQLPTKVDSRIILDQNGAERLVGKGDMLIMPPGSNALVRAKAAWVSDEEINKVVAFIKEQAAPEYCEELEKQQRAGEGEEEEDETTDEMFDRCVEVVLEMGRASTSLLQRKLALGYTRAAKIIDMMERKGIVGPANGAKPREIYYTLEKWLEEKGRAAQGVCAAGKGGDAEGDGDAGEAGEEEAAEAAGAAGG
ncbi:MAG: DNA translocase FtsK [Planctomycetota bacterium]|nr:DNA translocase FtsK [Planctomycetota bacterium]